MKLRNLGAFLAFCSALSGHAGGDGPAEAEGVAQQRSLNTEGPARRDQGMFEEARETIGTLQSFLAIQKGILENIIGIDSRMKEIEEELLKGGSPVEMVRLRQQQLGKLQEERERLSVQFSGVKKN